MNVMPKLVIVFISLLASAPLLAVDKYEYYDAISISGEAGKTFNVGALLEEKGIRISGNISLLLENSQYCVTSLVPTNPLVTKLEFLSETGLSNLRTTSNYCSHNGTWVDIDRFENLKNINVVFGNELRKRIELRSGTELVHILLTSEFFTPVHSNKIQNILDSATAFANKHGDLYTPRGCAEIVGYIASEAGVPINDYYWHRPEDNFDRSGQWKRIYRSDQDTRTNFNYQSILKAGDIVNTFLGGRSQHMYIVTKVFPDGSIETVDNTNVSSRIGRHIIRDANATDVSVYRLDESAATNVDFPHYLRQIRASK
jgi:hypothetical protein